MSTGFAIADLLFRYGRLRACWQNQPVDRSGALSAWISYPAIDFLSQFGFQKLRFLNGGDGSLTLWWSKRCKRIATVESNVRRLLPGSLSNWL
jgi:hypothetical protein